MRIALLIPAALLCAFAPQERNYEEYEVTKFRVRGSGNRWAVDMTLQHQFPKGAIISVEAKQRVHRFNWQSKEFHFGVDAFQKDSSLVNCESGARTLRTRNLTVSTPGMYEFWFWFDPNVQTRGRQLRRQMGDRNYFRYELPVLSRTIGDPGKMLAALRQDTAKCAKMIEKAIKLMDRIENESNDKDWKEKSASIFHELGEMKSEAEEQKAASLHNSAYQVITELLEDLVRVGNMIKKLQAEASGGAGEFGTGEGGEDPETTHPEEGGNEPIIGGADGKKLSISRMKRLLGMADVVRLREYQSWITLMHRDGLDSLWRTYRAAKKNPEKQGEFRTARNTVRSTNGELDKAFSYILSKKDWKKALEPWTLYKVGDEEHRYSDFPERFGKFMKILTADGPTSGAIPGKITEAHAEISKHLSIARAKVMGKL